MSQPPPNPVVKIALLAAVLVLLPAAGVAYFLESYYQWTTQPLSGSNSS